MNLVAGTATGTIERFASTIAAMGDDPAAGRHTAQLHADVLVLVAAGHPHARELAQAALRTRTS